MDSKKTPKAEPTKTFILTGARELNVGGKTYLRGQPIPDADAVGFEHYCRVVENYKPEPAAK